MVCRWQDDRPRGHDSEFLVAFGGGTCLGLGLRHLRSRSIFLVPRLDRHIQDESRLLSMAERMEQLNVHTVSGLLDALISRNPKH